MAYQGSNAIFDTLAGITIASFGFMVAFYTDSVSFIITAILFTFLSRSLSEYNKHEKKDNENFIKNHFAELKEGLALFKDSRTYALVF